MAEALAGGWTVPLVLLLLVLLVPQTVAGLGAASNRYAVSYRRNGCSAGR